MKGNSDEVSRWAAKITVRVGLFETEIEDIKRAVMVHDVGKIHARHNLLSKPAPLTAEEF